MLTMTAPSAWRATMPVSIVTSWAPYLKVLVAFTGYFPCERQRRSDALGTAVCAVIPKTFRAGGPALTHENQASTPQTEAADQVLIATLVRLLQIVEQLAALVHHLEQAAARVVVVLVTREVVRELGDPRRRQRD